MSTPMMATREALGELPNPLGLQGVEFIEYATSRPQALGQALGAGAGAHGLSTRGAPPLA